MSHTNESWHIWMSHGTYEWVMSHVWGMSHNSFMSHTNESCHVWTNQVQNLIESCKTWKNDLSCVKYTASHLLTLQHTATHCNSLQHMNKWCLMCEIRCFTFFHVATHCNTLHHTATRCNSLQHMNKLCLACEIRCFSLFHVATRCNTLQHTATHCTDKWNQPFSHKSTHMWIRWFSECHVGSVLQYVTACCNVLQCVAGVNR